MTAIFEALISYLTTETDYPAYSPGGIWAGVAPEKSTFPLTTWNLINSERGMAMGGMRWDVPLVQFLCCSAVDTPQEAIGMAERLRFWLEDSESRITIPGYKFVSITLESQNLLPAPDKGFMYQLDFSLDVEAI